MQSFKMIFSGVTILQGVEFPIFPIDFAWALQQCSATALPVMMCTCIVLRSGLTAIEIKWLLLLLLDSGRSTCSMAWSVIVVVVVVWQ